MRTTTASKTIFVDIELTHDEFVDYFDDRDSVVITKEVDVDVEFYTRDLLENIDDADLLEEAEERELVPRSRWEPEEDKIEDQFTREELDILIDLYLKSGVKNWDLREKLHAARYG